MFSVFYEASHLQRMERTQKFKYKNRTRSQSVGACERNKNKYYRALTPGTKAVGEFILRQNAMKLCSQMEGRLLSGCSVQITAIKILI